MDESAAVEVVAATLDEGQGIAGLDSEGCRALAARVVTDLHAAGYAGAQPVEMPTVWQWRSPATAGLWMDCQGKRHADRLLEAYGGQLRYRYESDWSDPSDPMIRKKGGGNDGE